MEMINGFISSVSLKKEGITNGRNWKMFEVNINDINFTCFDEICEELNGKAVTAVYENTTKNVNGKSYSSKTIKKIVPSDDSRESTSDALPPEANTRIETQLNTIIEKLNELLDRVI
jgi:hypothetical protein